MYVKYKQNKNIIMTDVIRSDDIPTSKLKFKKMPVSGGDVEVPDISLHDLLWQSLLERGDEIVMIDCANNERAISGKEIYNLSRTCAGYLQRQGIKKGDFVSICAEGSAEYAILMIGILATGATVTPCNPSYRKGEILQQFKISKPKMVFVDQFAIETMKSAMRDLPFLEKVIVVGESDEFQTVDEILKIGDPEKLEAIDINPADDLAIVPHSSGTTGLPKAIALTHRNFVAAFGLATELDSDFAKCAFINRPMYHTGGYGLLMMSMLAGIRCIYEKDDDTEKMLKHVEKYKVNLAFCVPPMLIELANFQNIDKYDLSSLKLIYSGGAAQSPDVIQRVMKKYKLLFLPGYGSTEAGGVSSGFPGCDLRSAGRISRGVEVKIVNLDTREECGVGDIGEILVRGPQVGKGYFGNPEATAAAFDSEGWFLMGDLGYFDKDNVLYVVDRIKEIIKYKTVQVSPAEIESVIIRHPKVSDVGVIGIPDEVAGEVPKAFVVRNDESLTLEDIHKIVADNLVEYKHLRGGVEFVDSIPKSPTGKIQRNILKKMAGC